MLLNVSFAGGMLGWALFVPIGFLLDPLFDWIGHRLDDLQKQLEQRLRDLTRIRLP